MISYYCIVNMPGLPVRDIAVIDATGDAGALMELARFTDQWPGYETVYLYQGERLIAVRANPQLGFARDAMILDDRAA